MRLAVKKENSKERKIRWGEKNLYGEQPVSRGEKLKGKTVRGRNYQFDFRKGQNATVTLTV